MAEANVAASLQLLAALCARGLRHLVLCPGSRSAPLAVAAALLEPTGLRLHTAIDERSAAFFALGLGRAEGVPAAVVTTSGTAVAQLLPAAVEADLGTIPLLLLSADRPERLKDCGANQAVPQEHFLRASTRRLLQGPPEGLASWSPRPLQQLAAEAMAAATGDGRWRPAGPVHLNLPFEEPLHANGEALARLAALARSLRSGEPSAATRAEAAALEPGARRTDSAAASRLGVEAGSVTRTAGCASPTSGPLGGEAGPPGGGAGSSGESHPTTGRSDQPTAAASQLGVDAGSAERTAGCASPTSGPLGGAARPPGGIAASSGESHPTTGRSDQPTASPGTASSGVSSHGVSSHEMASAWGAGPGGSPLEAAATLAVDATSPMPGATVVPRLDPDQPGVVVAGPWRGSPHDWADHCRALIAWQQRSGWPVLADPLSGLRGLPDLELVGAYDLLLESPPPNLRPPQVLRLGSLPASRRLERWLQACSGVQVLVSQGDPRRLDPLGTVPPQRQWSGGLAAWLIALGGGSVQDRTPSPASLALAQRWHRAESAAQRCLDHALTAAPASPPVHEENTTTPTRLPEDDPSAASGIAAGDPGASGSPASRSADGAVAISAVAISAGVIGADAIRTATTSAGATSSGEISAGEMRAIGSSAFSGSRTTASRDSDADGVGASDVDAKSMAACDPALSDTSTSDGRGSYSRWSHSRESDPPVHNSSVQACGSNARPTRERPGSTSGAGEPGGNEPHGPETQVTRINAARTTETLAHDPETELTRAAVAAGSAIETEALNEPWLARSLSRLLPPGLPLMLASSSPVRDWAAFADPQAPGRPVYGFRGASGIDGTLSIACGLAEALGQLVLVSGDLALLHDANGWLWRRQLRGRLTVVLIENGGGGIFEQLPIRSDPPEHLDFERLFAMPQAVDQLALAALHGVPGRRLQRPAELAAALAWALAQPFALLEVRTQRGADAQWRQQLRRRVGAVALADQGGSARF